MSLKLLIKSKREEEEAAQAEREKAEFLRLRDEVLFGDSEGGFDFYNFSHFLTTSFAMAVNLS